MKWSIALIAMLLLSACATTGTSADALCGIERPTFTAEELAALSDRTLDGLDLYFERIRRACEV